VNPAYPALNVGSVEITTTRHSLVIKVNKSIFFITLSTRK